MSPRDGADKHERSRAIPNPHLLAARPAIEAARAPAARASLRRLVPPFGRLALAAPGSAYAMSAESLDLAWFAWDDLPADTDASVRLLVAAARSRL